VASVTTIGEAAALIDVGDAFDPQLGDAAGIDLHRMLWVRPKTLKQAVAAAEMVVATGFQLVVVDAGLPPLRGRVPDASWVRLARAAEAHGSALLVSAPYPITGTTSVAMLRAEPARGRWNHGLLLGVDTMLRLEKHRRKRPGQHTRLAFEVGETFSPRVEDAGDGLVFVDISGTERHYPSEEELAKAALRAMDGISLPARVGVAACKLAARVATELAQTPTIVAPGDEAKFLAPLPLARLSPEMGAAAMLHRFGLESIGDLARLPDSEIASRLGEIGRELHFAARGVDPRPLIPRALPPEFREGME